MKTLLSLTTTASLALSGGSFASAQHYTQNQSRREHVGHRPGH